MGRTKLTFWKRLFGYIDRCQCIGEDGSTCLDRQKNNFLMYTCDYCYFVGNGIIKKGEILE